MRLLRVDGVQLDGIHYLRALGNADTIRADTEDAEHVVVIGGSYIATEVAASLTLLGRKVYDAHAGDGDARAFVRRAGRPLLPGACSRRTASRSTATTRSPASRARTAG